MRVINYQGGSSETSYLHPELFTILAPPEYQMVCRLFGGTPVGTDKPRFRLALMASRFRLSGGREVTTVDDSGNVRKKDAEELFIPRYLGLPPVQHGMYVLERWKSQEELYAGGAGRVSVEYGPDGKSYRQMEPVWDDGCYVPVYWRFQQPHVLPRDAAIDWADSEISIRWAMFSAIKALEYTFDDDIESKREVEAQAKQKAAGTQLHKETLKENHRSSLFVEPAISMCG